MRRAKSGKVRLGNTFNEGEVLMLDFVVRQLMAGKMPDTAARNVHFGKLAKKVAAMKLKVDARVALSEAVQNAG